MARAQAFDYIVIGAGSAGCTLANRLSEDDDVTVLVLEAGDWDRDIWIHMPLGWGRLLQERRHDWGYDTEPMANMDGRAIECARGKVIGGSSSINAMAYVRGHRGDYDRWASYGLPDWNYARVLPYFRRQESWEGGASPYRGGDGPLMTQMARYEDPLVDAYAEAARADGHPFTDDYNGAQQEGFCRMQMTIGNGKRCSGAVGYLRPAMARPNLRVETKALVTRIAFEGRRAVGVDYVQDGKTASVRAEREVIVAGGTINSPQTLMLSGIGDPAALKAHGIPVNVALRGVGQNLQDHPTTLVTYARVEGGPLYRNMRMDRLAVALADAYLRGRGFATSLPSGVTAFLKSDPGETLPDIQLLFVAAPFGSKPYLPFAKPPFADGFALRAVVLRPESRGHIALASADPAAKPRIHQSLLATDEDWRRMKAAIRLFRDLVNRGPVQRFVKGELMPGRDATSDAALEAHARKTAITVHHPCGTCRMGAVADETAVVDPALRVRGVDGLRVVDASVFPDLVGGNINAAVVMIAEKAADMIRGRAPLPPAAV